MGQASCSQAQECPPCCSGSKQWGTDAVGEYMPQHPKQANREHVEAGPPMAAGLREIVGVTFDGSLRHNVLGGTQPAKLLIDSRVAGRWQRDNDILPVVIEMSGSRIIVKDSRVTFNGTIGAGGSYQGEVIVDGEGGGTFTFVPAVGGGSSSSASPAQSRGGRQQLQVQDLSNESYFARELKELSTMPPIGPDGRRPVHRFRTGATYVGQWKNNLRHGIGTMVWPDGATFTGQWKNNFAEGLGRFVHAEGDVFIGQWQKSAAQGLGIYYHKGNLTVYGGQWVEDLQHGYGVEKWEGGSEYHGQFSWGRKEGSGVYHWPDGSQYSGQWQANSISGKGHYLGRDGREFRGMWKEAVIHGCGQYCWPDKRMFQGQYADDKKHGLGIFVWQDGRRFEGFWHQGKQHGHGTIYMPGGKIAKQGFWNMGAAPEGPGEHSAALETLPLGSGASSSNAQQLPV
mmetsp:Transcript_57882/g.123075  ORF Transcript_57882/g.123075 Transcript_57882/m.123075 type:complete len:455 (-) Transcript_57882:176-1540(-)